VNCSETCFGQGPPEILYVGSVQVPVFLKQEREYNEFSIDNAAEIHDNAMQWLHNVHGTDEKYLRETLVNHFALQPGFDKRVLVTSAGAGNDLEYLFDRYPDAHFYVQDIAYEMLEAAILRNQEIISGKKVTFFVCDALDLPIEDNFFDAAYHFGGINLFSDIKQGLHETHRVVREGGVIQFGDEGIADWMKNYEIGDVLINNNSLYECRVPLHLLPLEIDDFSLRYLFNNCFYLVRYVKSPGPKINLDVSHRGTRGGSLRTRFYGKLEGVSPELKGDIFDLASRMGISRVEFLETIISEGLKKYD
jgi:ubiquinone/menaquinone biosynthesis C-methylase UbiE